MSYKCYIKIYLNISVDRIYSKVYSQYKICTFYDLKLKKIEDFEQIDQTVLL